ncbi:Ish1 domain-containing protein [uncultured Vagococcus sp.]|nr:Ish1 domain-containing protein [uncultured Vagococcus sp.]
MALPDESWEADDIKQWLDDHDIKYAPNTKNKYILLAKVGE